MASAEGAAPQGTAGRLFQGVSRQEFGFKMLQSMGWSEGQGLGASGTGITKHIAAVRRQDQIGIGADIARDSSAKIEWSVNMQNFDQILAGLESVGAVHEPPRKSKKSKKEEKKEKKSKKEKKEKKSKKEETVLRVAAPARGRPQGRYAKREAGKMVLGYSQEDLSMILGVAPADFVAPAAMVTAPCQEPEAGDKARKKRRRERSPAHPPAAEVAEAAAEEEEEPKPWMPPAPDWWGASMFRWAGRLGGIRRSSKHEKGFCEGDQVAAYNAVHDGATHGKQGLGVRDAPKKVAGARWAGTKLRLGDESGEDDPVPEPAADADAGLRKIKWKKLAEAALRALPGGSATLSALRRSVLATAGIGDSKGAREALSRRLTASRRFAIEGDSVRLVAGGEDGDDE